MDGIAYLTEECSPPISPSVINIGSYYNSTQYFTGYLQDLRFTNTCKYINSFTPPQMPLGKFKGYPISICKFEGTNNGTTFIDKIGNLLTANGSAITSTNDSKFGSSSGYFSSSSDYISISNGLSNFNFGDSDFTIECWVKTTNNGGGVGYIFNQSQSGRNLWIRFGDSSVNHALQASVGDSTFDIITSSLTKSDFSSNFRHVQLVKRFRLFVLFVDGIAVGSKEMVFDPTPKGSILLHLHMNGSNASTTFTDSSVFARTMTANGNVQISTTQSKFGGASALFDGIGDYISTTYSNSFAMYMSDWTFECWFYISTLDLTNGNAIFCISGTVGSRSLEVVTYGNGTQEFVRVSLFSNGTDAFSLFGTTALSINTWYHVAVVRYRGFVTLYLNGNIERSIPYNLPLYTPPTTINIGRIPAVTNADFFGYIDELRFISGFAKYLTTFTPPSSAFDETLPDPILFSTPASVQIGGLVGYLDSFQVWMGDAPRNRFLTVPSSDFPSNSLDIIETSRTQTALTNPQNIGVGVGNLFPGKLGNSSGYFNGKNNSTGFLRYRLSDDDWIYDQDFTIEFWVMFFDTPPGGTYRYLLSNRNNYANYCYINLNRDSSGGLELLFNNSSGGSWATMITSSNITSLFSWHHVAITKTGYSIQLFLDGVSQGIISKPILNQIPFYSYFYIGSGPTQWLSHFRLYRSISIYSRSCKIYSKL